VRFSLTINTEHLSVISVTVRKEYGKVESWSQLLSNSVLYESECSALVSGHIDNGEIVSVPVNRSPEPKRQTGQFGNGTITRPRLRHSTTLAA
jgi:hypothetical protein